MLTWFTFLSTLILCWVTSPRSIWTEVDFLFESPEDSLLDIISLHTAVWCEFEESGILCFKTSRKTNVAIYVRQTLDCFSYISIQLVFRVFLDYSPYKFNIIVCWTQILTPCSMCIYEFNLVYRTTIHRTEHIKYNYPSIT